MKKFIFILTLFGSQLGAQNTGQSVTFKNLSPDKIEIHMNPDCDTVFIEYAEGKNLSFEVPDTVRWDRIWFVRPTYQDVSDCDHSDCFVRRKIPDGLTGNLGPKCDPGVQGRGTIHIPDTIGIKEYPMPPEMYIIKP